MCGIAGAIAWRGPAPTAGDVTLMVDAMHHRGPDDHGVVQRGPAVLGHSRLSILDLTSAAHQPMPTEDGRFWLTFNGEIYNFGELRRELESRNVRFRSSSDTEVLLLGFASWGDAIFRRLNGIWATAIWDAAEQTLTLSRDRFGVKPLFVTGDSERLAFASEVGALHALPWVNRQPDDETIGDYLLAGHVDRGNRTFFRGIRRISPGGVEIYSSSGVRTTRYWAPAVLSDDISGNSQASDVAAIADLRERLERAVERQLQSDVPTGSCLSGGIDSSSIVALTASVRDRRREGPARDELDRVNLPSASFHVRFDAPGLDESRYAREIAGTSGIRLETATPSAEDFYSSLLPTVRTQGEPFGSSSIVAQYMVMRLARDSGVTVLLDGQGADELLAGYKWYLVPRIRGGGVWRNPTFAIRAASSVSWRMIRGEIAPLGILHRLRHSPGRIGRPIPESTRLQEFAGRNATLSDHAKTPAATPPGSMLSRALWRDLTSDSLPALLRYEDRNSMAFSIEARVPFLDHEVVDLALALPDRLRIDPTETKIALRRAMRGAVPWSILGRRDKLGFAPPQDAWLRATLGRLATLAVHPEAEESGYLVAGAVDASIRAFAARRLRHEDLWRVLNLEIWLRLLAGRDSIPDPRTP